MNIPSGHKFGCLAYSGFALDALAPDIHLGPRLGCATSLGFDVEEAKGLGSINFALYTTLPSQTLDVVDEQNGELPKPVQALLYGLLLQGSPASGAGCVLTGVNIDGRMMVQSFSALPAFRAAHDAPLYRPHERHLRRAVTLAKRLRLAADGGRDWARLCRGLEALATGSQAPEDGERLHQFVRVLDAVLPTEARVGRTPFAERIEQTFVRPGDEARATLAEICDLGRHGEPPAETLRRRARQADTLARFVLLRVFDSEALFNTFKSDASVESFWKMTDVARGMMWGARLDLSSIP
jgi:hypothetical protein